VAELLSAAARGETQVLEAMEESGRWLGRRTASLVNIFNPSRVALGGLHARIYPYTRQAMERELYSRAMPAPPAIVEFTTASLGADALLLGAAELTLAPILHDPAIVSLAGDPAISVAGGAPAFQPLVGRRTPAGEGRWRHA
jgi:predicted NBD/HSP70 family sugar kinase